MGYALMKAVRIEKLYKEYDNNGSEKLNVLRGVDLEIDKGEFVCILGPSGCGKSTLLRCIGGFEKPTNGHIFVQGKEVSAPGPQRSMVFQSFDQLFPWKTVIGNITLPLEVNGIGKTKEDREAIAKHYLEIVGLADFGKYYPHQLSGGMKQRVAIVRSLALDPDVILMDEPFASLDADMRSTLQEELYEIWQKTRITILFVTHNIWESLILSSKIVVMQSRGERSVKEILKNPVPECENRIRTPQDPNFTECWGHLQKAIRINNNE